MTGRVVLAGACRTAIGSMGGALSTVPIRELGAIVIKGALSRINIRPEQVDFIYMGCVLQAGLGRNAARQSSIQAGIPVETPVVTINVVYGSGLNCVNLVVQMMRSGDADTVVAGGVEDMSMVLYLPKDARYGYRMNNGTMVDSMARDALWDVLNDYHMGIIAENIVEQWGPTRQELDEFAAASRQEACAAVESGQFKDEIVLMEVEKEEETAQSDTDEGPRPKTTAEGIAKLRPASKRDGVVIAANVPNVNDGAAAVVVMSEEKAEELDVKLMAYWRAGALAGVAPEIMSIRPVVATKEVLAETGMRIEDFDLVEASEALAARSLAMSRELSFTMPKVNVNGGAIAPGHPVGASGCHIPVILLYGMDKRDAKKGLVTLCIGGGMGCVAIVEREQCKRKDKGQDVLYM